MSTRHPLTTGATGHAGRPFLSSHDRRAGSRRYRPRSVPTHTRPPESAASARTRFAHSAPGDEGRPRVTIPLGATYCHSGPSCEKSQLVHVLPPSVDSPHPFPTVPYQISPPGPNPNACTKSHEMEWALVSLECLICSQLPAPGRSTKMPCPYVPTQRALSGARVRASTWTPKPLVSGSGGSCWAPEGSGAPIRILATP